MSRAHNFSPGPCTLPEEVLQELSEELPEFNNSGMSLIEMSHRGDIYMEIHQEAIDTLAKLSDMPEDFQILFLQGGATLQFSMVPLNRGIESAPAAYISAGTWGKKAYADAKKLGQAYLAWDGEESNYTRMPTAEELSLKPDTRYLHATSNETVHGVRMPDFPALDAPYVIDMSSEYLTRSIPWDTADIIYGGAQKSLGPAGLCVVFVRKSILEESPDLPAYLRYQTHAAANSLANTPSVFSIWATGKMLRWIEKKGGTNAMEKQARDRSNKIYTIIDESNGFYNAPVAEKNRSLTNIVFRLQTEEKEKEFLEATAKENLLNLRGHRSIGGIRASIYNGMQEESVTLLAGFMENFAAQQG